MKCLLVVLLVFGTITVLGQTDSIIGKRAMIQKPDLNNIKSDEECQIYLRLTIDSIGNVIQCVADPTKTFVVNRALIEKTCMVVQEQIKYSKGRDTSHDILVVRLHPNIDYTTVRAKNPRSKDLTDGKEYKIETVCASNAVYVRNDKGQVKRYSMKNFEPQD